MNRQPPFTTAGTLYLFPISKADIQSKLLLWFRVNRQNVTTISDSRHPPGYFPFALSP